MGGQRVRVTYDGTTVDLLTPSNRHENLKSVLRNFVVFAQASDLAPAPKCKGSRTPNLLQSSSLT